jgi:hypothetical protein
VKPRKPQPTKTLTGPTPGYIRDWTPAELPPPMPKRQRMVRDIQVVLALAVRRADDPDFDDVWEDVEAMHTALRLQGRGKTSAETLQRVRALHATRRYIAMREDKTITSDFLEGLVVELNEATGDDAYLAPGVVSRRVLAMARGEDTGMRRPGNRGARWLAATLMVAAHLRDGSKLRRDVVAKTADDLGQAERDVRKRAGTAPTQ